MLRKTIAAALMLSASVLCGCGGGTPAASESTAAPTETAPTETAPAVTEKKTAEYPCKFTAEEMKCVYGGNEVYGNIYIPRNGFDTHPAVIFSHGYNCVGDDMKDIAETLAENGVVTYTYDFRGGCPRSKSSGSTVDMSIETEQEDLRHVIDMIAGLEYCDEKNIYLYGESQGGFVSALTGAESPEKIAGMFLIYPAFCIPNDWLKMDPEAFAEPSEFMGMTISKAFYDGVPRYDVYEHVAKFGNYVHIFHGDSDPVVNLSYSEKLVKSFPNAELTVVKGAGHWMGGADRDMLKSSLKEYFVTNGLV